MISFEISSENSSQVEILFYKNKKTPIKKQDLRLSKEFLWNLTDENIETIYHKIIEFDGTAARRLNKDGVFRWSINLNDYPNFSNRFNSLVPKLCRSCSLEKTMYSFQNEGKEWLLQSPTRILADDMGLGKTIQSIAAIEEGIFTGIVNNVIVICPNPLVTNWRSELNKWCPLLSVFILPSQRAGDKGYIKKNINNHNIFISTYSALTKLASVLKKEEVLFDLIVADEAHKLRNETSQINQAFRLIPRKKTWFLTGTPLERDEADIRNMLYCLDPKNPSYIDKKTTDSVFKYKLSEVSLRRLKKNVLKDLPAVHRTCEILEMCSDQTQGYRAVLKEMQLVPQIERIGFLTKLSIAAIVSKDGSSCKFDRAVEICDIAKEADKKVIIFSNYNDALKQLRKHLTKSNIGSSLLTGEIERDVRDRHISAFEDDSNITSLLCNSRIGGEGLTLTVASVVIFLNEWWNPSSNRQAEDRVNRIGQTEKVLIYILRSNDTIDENLGVILNNKNLIEKDFLEQLANEISKQSI